MYILDKGIFLTLFYGNSSIVNKVLDNAKRCYLPAIIAAELYANKLNFSTKKQHDVERAIGKFIKNSLIADFGISAASEFGKIQQQLKYHGKAASTVDKIVSATALSLDGTVITDRPNQFRIIAPHLKVENWKDPSPILSVTSNEPGALFQVADFFRKHKVNIIEASSNGNFEGFSRANDLCLIIALPYGMTVEKLKSRIDCSNASFSETRSNRVKLQFKCHPPNNNKRQDDREEFKYIQVRGNDRVGILADVTRLIAKRNINIVNYCNILSQIPDESSDKFSMRFTLSDMDIDWDALLEEIRAIEKDINAYFIASFFYPNI